MHDIRGLAITRVETDADLETLIAVRAAADPERTPPRIENLRNTLQTLTLNTFLVARLHGEPAACGFVYTGIPAGHAEGHVVVVPGLRRRGIGSAMLAAAAAIAEAGEKEELEGETREVDTESRAYLERRGYRVVGGEKWLSFDLDGVDAVTPDLPADVTIVSRAERPDLTDALFEVAVEGTADIPGFPGPTTYEQFRSIEIDRPTRKPELFFIALVGDEPVGYATLDDLGRDAYNGLTAVKRAWRRRGIATALKRTQIAAAKRAGFRRLVTGSEERNTPMRSLNGKLGYLPEPHLNTLVLRGPTDVRSRNGDDRPGV